jgi:hypothetical protein
LQHRGLQDGCIARVHEQLRLQLRLELLQHLRCGRLQQGLHGSSRHGSILLACCCWRTCAPTQLGEGGELLLLERGRVSSRAHAAGSKLLLCRGSGGCCFWIGPLAAAVSGRSSARRGWWEERIGRSTRSRWLPC